LPTSRVFHNAFSRVTTKFDSLKANDVDCYDFIQRVGVLTVFQQPVYFFSRQFDTGRSNQAKNIFMRVRFVAQTLQFGNESLGMIPDLSSYICIF